ASKLRQSLFKITSNFLDVLDQPVFYETDGSECRGAGDRIPAEGRTMSAACPRTNFLPRNHPPQWHTAGNSFGNAKNIGLDTPMLTRKHLAGASESGLNLVHNQENPVPPTQVF